MKFFKKLKDGGPDSNVTGYFLIEIKSLFSIALLHFSNGTREAFHSHAFNSISWLLKGKLEERHSGGRIDVHTPKILPIMTERTTIHQVCSVGNSWALTIRGPWAKYWVEYIPKFKETRLLTHGRKVVWSNDESHSIS